MVADGNEEEEALVASQSKHTGLKHQQKRDYLKYAKNLTEANIYAPSDSHSRGNAAAAQLL